MAVHCYIIYNISDKPPTVNAELCCTSGDTHSTREHIPPVSFKLHWLPIRFI